MPTVLDRREFLGHLTKGAIAARLLLASTTAGTALALGGCSVWSDISTWIPVAETALNGIVTILGANGFPVSQAASALIATTLAALKQLLADVQIYQSITPPPVGTLAKIEAAFGVITSNFQAFLASIQIPNSPLLSTIIAIAQVILSTIAGFQNRLPTGTSTVVTSMSIGVGQGATTQIAVAPKARNTGNFKRDWNSVIRAGAKAGVKMPDGAYMTLTFSEHLHFK